MLVVSGRGWSPPVFNLKVTTCHQEEAYQACMSGYENGGTAHMDLVDESG